MNKSIRFRPNTVLNCGEELLFFWSSPDFGEKTLEISAKTFFFGVHSISATELHNFHFSLNKYLRRPNAFGQGSKSVPPCKILQFKYWEQRPFSCGNTEFPKQVSQAYKFCWAVRRQQYGEEYATVVFSGYYHTMAPFAWARRVLLFKDDQRFVTKLVLVNLFLLVEWDGGWWVASHWSSWWIDINLNRRTSHAIYGPTWACVKRWCCVSAQQPIFHLNIALRSVWKGELLRRWRDRRSLGAAKRGILTSRYNAPACGLQVGRYPEWFY